MRKIILPVLLIVLSLQTIAQTAKDSTKNKYPAVGIVFSPDYCYRAISSSNSHYNSLISARNELEIPKFSYTIGIGLKWRLAKRLGLDVALQYSDKGFNTKRYYMNTGSYNTATVYSTSAITKLHYIYTDLLIKTNIYLVARKFKLYIVAGGIVDAFNNVKEVDITSYSDGSTRTSVKIFKGDAYNRITFSMIAGIGASYDFGKRLNISLEPVYRRSLGPSYSGDFHEYLYSYGINVGVYYRF